MSRTVFGLSAGIWLLVSAAATAQIDHLEFVRAPQLLDCQGQPAFRLLLNAVDAQSVPVVLSISDTEAVKRFRLLVPGDAREPFYARVFASDGQAQAPSNYLLLLLDTSGSMNLKLRASQETRFSAAKRAVLLALRNLNDGVDHVAIAPFDSHNVIRRIDEAVFQSSLSELDQEVRSIDVPKGTNNTALYSAVVEALRLLKGKADAGFPVSLVVFTDGRNDVNNPGDDRGLLGDDGLETVKRLAAQMQVPITTVAFGIAGDPTAQSALREMAWPGPDHYYDASDAQRLQQILELTRRKLTDRIQLTFWPAETSREKLAGQTLRFRAQLTPTDGKRVFSRAPEPAWHSPSIGAPLFEGQCSPEESQAMSRIKNAGPLPPINDLLRRLGILAMFATLLLVLWFGAPRWVWPESYISKPSLPSLPSPGANLAGTLPGGARQGPSMIGNVPPPGRFSPPMQPPRTATVNVPSKPSVAPGAGFPRVGTPRAPEPAAERTARDETIDHPPRKGGPANQ